MAVFRIEEHLAMLRKALDQTHLPSSSLTSEHFEAFWNFGPANRIRDEFNPVPFLIFFERAM